MLILLWAFLSSMKLTGETKNVKFMLINCRKKKGFAGALDMNLMKNEDL